MRIAVAASMVLLALVGQSLAQSLQLRNVRDLPDTPAPQVIGANPADPARWPGTFVFKNTEGGGCSATAIGRQVILTAAHCVEDGATGSASVGAVEANVVCNRHPSYPKDVSADFSLCFAKTPLPKPGGGFERVNTEDVQMPAMQQAVTLLGYGCTTRGGGDRGFGTLFEGTANVSARPGKDLYLITTGGAAVCFGDSGGGAYYSTNPANTTRRLFGVNSRGDISKTSWISTTANPAFLDWARRWAAANNSRMCGVTANAEDCRQ